jgi:hypothetical protein
LIETNPKIHGRAFLSLPLVISVGSVSTSSTCQLEGNGSAKNALRRKVGKKALKMIEIKMHFGHYKIFFVDDRFIY